MPRPEYPSDIARRRSRPHVKVHLTARSHRRTAELFMSPEERGMLLGLWMCAVEAYAGRNGNKVYLDRTSVMWITGRTQYAHGERALRALCARMEYAVSAHGALVVVEVRNLLQKQGMDSARRGATPHDSVASDSASASASEKKKKREEPRAPRARGLRTPPPESWPEALREPLIRRLWKKRPHLLLPEPPKPHCTRAWIYAEAEDCLDWHRKESRTAADWVAAAANWIAKSDTRLWPDGLPRAAPLHDLAARDPDRYLPRELRTVPAQEELMH